MPKGPKGEKRPADAASNAVRVMQIATGQLEESPTTSEGKSAAAAQLGRMGGRARAKSLTKAERAKIAKKAAKARWKRK